jgi:hypothetical protein
MKTTPDDIAELEPNQVFVFGSNRAGIHGAGAARLAAEWGAEWGKGEGLSGQTYGIPTKDKHLHVLSLTEIAEAVERFIDFAEAHQELEFLVTKIGCGLAGYSPDEIKLCFTGLPIPANVSLPKEFQ